MQQQEIKTDFGTESGVLPLQKLKILGGFEKGQWTEAGRTLRKVSMKACRSLCGGCR